MIQNRRQLARQQQAMLVNDHYTKATQFEAQREFDKARVELENAQLIMRFDPYETDFGVRKTDVDELLGVVQRRLDEQKRASESEEYRKAYDKLVEQENAAKRREDEQIKNLLVAAIESFQRGEFDNTELQANKVLRYQPGNQKAKELVECARQAKHSQWRANFYKQKRDQFDRWMLDIRAAQVPDPTAAEVGAAGRVGEDQRRAPSAATSSTGPRALTEPLQAIKSKLDNETVSWDYGENQQPFEEVIKQIRTTTGINIVVDPDVQAEKGQEPISITLRDYKLGGALRILLGNLKLDFVLKDDVLYITTRREGDGQGDAARLRRPRPHREPPALQGSEPEPPSGRRRRGGREGDLGRGPRAHAGHRPLASRRPDPRERRPRHLGGRRPLDPALRGPDRDLDDA